MKMQKSFWNRKLSGARERVRATRFSIWMDAKYIQHTVQQATMMACVIYRNAEKTDVQCEGHDGH